MMKFLLWRRASWFGVMAVLLAFWVVILGSVPPDASGGFIPSHRIEKGGSRDEDLNRLQRFLETEIARQKLKEYGVSADIAHSKLQEMSDQDLHVLAAMADRIPEGGDAVDALVVLFTVSIVLAAVFLLILVILGVMGIGALAKHLRKKSQPQQSGPPPEPAVEPAK